MASVGQEQADNSVQESEDDSAELLGAGNHQVHKNNGIYPACHCGEVMAKSLAGKRTKIDSKFRVNGVNRCPSVPYPKSPNIGVGFPADFTARRRKSSKLDKNTDSNGLIQLKNVACRVERCVNNNRLQLGSPSSGPAHVHTKMHLEPSHILSGPVGSTACTCAHSGNAKHSGSVHTSNRPIPNGCTRSLIKKSTKLDGEESLVFLDSSLSYDGSLNRSHQKISVNTANSYSGSSLSISTSCANNIVKSAPSSPLRIGASCSSQGSKDVHVPKHKEIPPLVKKEPPLAQVECNRDECKWDDCGDSVETGLLMDHIKAKHVDVQLDCETFVCLWDGCKVHDKKSCSLSWLERHVLSHSGDKPFQCIVGKCCQRFSTQGALQRHVNNHFNTYQQSSSPKSSRSERDTPSKLLRKKRLKGKRSRHVRTNDYFDSHTVEFVKRKVAKLNSTTAIDTLGDGNAFTFQSTVIGQRTDRSGQTMCLVHWTPEGILPNEWMPESQATEMIRKTIPLSQLPQENLHDWDSHIIYNPLRHRKHRRK